MKLLIVTVISISAGLFAIYFALLVKAQATALMDTMNIQRLDFASGLSHQDILIKYLESFVELSTKPLQPVNDDVDFAIKVGKHALKPLQVEVRVIILNYFCGLHVWALPVPAMKLDIHVGSNNMDNRGGSTQNTQKLVYR